MTSRIRKIPLTFSSKGYMAEVVTSLVQFGWNIISAPSDGRVNRNGQLFTLRSEKNDSRYRIFVYKVTGSSRGRPDERRIEITSTYQKGLKRLRKYQDIVLGYDEEHDIFVGIDPRRVQFGGPTGNASSFFDKVGLQWKSSDEILVRPRMITLFPTGVEFHAFFKASCIADYVLNVTAIHRGTYSGQSIFPLKKIKKSVVTARMIVPDSVARGIEIILAGPKLVASRRNVADSLIKSFENNEVRKIRRAKLTPQELLDIKRRCEENGVLGEEYVLEYERKRLRKAGKLSLSNKIRWISQESATAGYDILSFERNGDKRFIEVKSTSGNGRSFEMSRLEWQTAQDKGERYYLYRVTEVRKKPHLEMFQNLYDIHERGLVKKTPSGWRITLL